MVLRCFEMEENPVCCYYARIRLIVKITGTSGISDGHCEVSMGYDVCSDEMAVVVEASVVTATAVDELAIAGAV